MRLAFRALVLSVFSIVVACKPDIPDDELFCYGDGLCIAPDGAIVDSDGTPRCDVTGTCGDSDPGDAGDTIAPGDDFDPGCICEPSASDADGDCIEDASEQVCEGMTNDEDTDDDGVRDGCEDYNRDGERQSYEMDPCNADTDGDGIADGIEDANHNGRHDAGESWATREDSDGDGIPDAEEDPNGNGIVDPWEDTNGNGCFDRGVDTPGETDPASTDSDGDGLSDELEDANGNGVCDADETCAFVADTDCDRLPDGKEDKNGNRTVNTGETDPLNPDTDGDGILDGTEDANLNGSWDQGAETHPLRTDTDGDGIPDGKEDRDHDGELDVWHECSSNTEQSACESGADGEYCVWSAGACVAQNAGGQPGVFDPGIDVPGETNPRVVDTDGDQVPDGMEDVNRDGLCNAVLRPQVSVLGRTAVCPEGQSQCESGAICEEGICKLWGSEETCGFLADTDSDGLDDGVEDVDRNGLFSIGETDPRMRDTDRDGLLDGCPSWARPTECEDQNNDGIVNVGETDPMRRDTDEDGLLDGCEQNFDPSNCSTDPCSTDPLNEDTDGDGFADGQEDVNHNCLLDPGETDPRVFTEPPPVGTEERARFNVCATTNLKSLTFAASAREGHDYRLALEVEESEAGERREYIVHPYGKDVDGNGFVASDEADVLWGHAFQSPGEVYDQALGTELSRDVYGFLLATTTATEQPLDDVLDEVVDALSAAYSSVVQVADTTARPAHDSIDNPEPMADFLIQRAQRKLEIDLQTDPGNPTQDRTAAYRMRNEILRSLLLHFDPDAIAADELPANLPREDQVHGSINCPTNARCFNDFSVHVSAVQRRAQKVALDSNGRLVTDADGQPALVFVVALTPNDSELSETAFQRHEDRLTRLEDLTGGSALGRFAADRSKTCEKKAPQMATADMLWVVDDSASMQQMIERMQRAAADARDVLTANSAIVDFRVAMTTTNPSVGARTQCVSFCDEACTGAGELSDPNSAARRCTRDCASQELGCLKVCPSTCSASCSGPVCTCSSCSSPDVCGSADTCLNPDWLPQILQCDADLLAYDAGEPLQCSIASASSDPRDWMLTAPLGDLNRYPLPGGGGTFYYEDSEYLDCVSAAGSSALQMQDQFTNSCAGYSGFAPFFDAGARKQLLGNAGFLGADDAASCQLSSMDLTYEAGDTEFGDCIGSCERLTSACTDGPTVLTSQMCDLIRAMGGLPCQVSGRGTDDFNSSSNTTSGSRPHSAAENGTRAARRLIASMLPAYPRDYGTEAERRQHLRLDCAMAGSGKACPNGLDAECDLYETCNENTLQCEPTGNCQPCDPRDPPIGASGASCSSNDDCPWDELCDGTTCRMICAPVPLATIFLSDEEDFYFKDECIFDKADPPPAPNWVVKAQQVADKSQLPELCYWMDDDPDDGLAYDPTAVVAQCAALGDQTSCEADTACKWTSGACQPALLGKACTLEYCDAQGYYTGWPNGYDPDLTAQTTSKGFSLAWRTGSDAACSSDPGAQGTSCIGNPCSSARTESDCNAYGSSWCTWTGYECIDVCKAYTLNTPGSDAEWEQQRQDCVADARCAWDEGQVEPTGQRDACTLRFQWNDCQACKRLVRTLESIGCAHLDDQSSCLAVPGCSWANGACSGMIGFGDVGPVYAIVRDKGVEGYADFNSAGRLLEQDECLGGSITWGRGDGQSYRDLAVATLGRTQNVCTQGDEGYRPFLQQLITDIASLSSPYPLAQAPIASTIKVGIARADGTGFEYLEVPRSSTSGFFFDPTTNSIGFKSDPVDGICSANEQDPTGGGSCSADDVIEESEINYAKNASHVPREGDIVFVSYRFWLPVPCQERCGDGESCVQLSCPAPDEVSRAACTEDADCILLEERCLTGNICSESGTTCETANDCPAGESCAEETSCRADCRQGETLEMCTCGECPACHTCDTETGECVLWTTDPCECDPRHEDCRTARTEADCHSDERPYCSWDPGTSSCGLSQRCVPGEVNTCSSGYVCDESCVCVRPTDCSDGFYANGTVRDCAAAEQCCRDWAIAAAICPTKEDFTSCTTDPNTSYCEWFEDACRPTHGPCCAAELLCGECVAGQSCNETDNLCDPPIEESVCEMDPETGQQYIRCEVNDFCECDPPCDPQTQWCSAAAGCRCVAVPPMPDYSRW